MFKSLGRTAILVLFAVSIVTPVKAIAQESGGNIKLELNQVQSTQSGGCRLSVIATNGLERPMAEFGLEVVAFDEGGMVDRFLKLTFPRISAGKTRVLQFVISGKTCDKLSRLHINDALNCVPASVENVYCPDLLNLSNRTSLQFSD